MNSGLGFAFGMSRSCPLAADDLTRRRERRCLITLRDSNVSNLQDHFVPTTNRTHDQSNSGKPYRSLSHRASTQSFPATYHILALKRPASEVSMGDMRDRVAATQPNWQTSSAVSKPSPRKLSVGVVGIGRMGQRHALNLLRLVPRATLVCACSPADVDIEWAEEQLVPYGVAVFRTFEEMIDFLGLQAVIIASATSLHYEHTFECLERGVHVICEKPVAGSLVEVSTSGVSYQMMSNNSSWSA